MDSTVIFWLGVLTPFVIILAVGLLWLTLIGLRWLNGKVHDRFIRYVRFIDTTIDERGLESREYATPNSHGHDRQALELAHILAAAPGCRMLSIGPWRIVIVHDYTTEGGETGR